METLTKRSVRLAAAGAVLGAVLGCASAPKPSVTKTKSDLGLGDERAPASVLTARDAYPFIDMKPDEPVPGVETRAGDGSLVSRWQVTEGDHSGKVIREERTQEGADSWRIRTVLEGEEKAIEELVLRYDRSTGAVILADDKQIDRGIRVVMRPQPASMPPELSPGKSVTQNMTLRMPYLDDPRRLRAEGKGEMTLTYEADQPMTVGGRRVDARRVREVFATDVTAAKAVRTTERWFVPGLGRVGEQWVEEVRVLGLVSERTVQAVRLLPP